MSHYLWTVARLPWSDFHLLPVVCGLTTVDYYLAVDCGYRETLHETGITVPTTMPTTYIPIVTVIKTGDGRLGQNGLCKDFFDFH